MYGNCSVHSSTCIYLQPPIWGLCSIGLMTDSSFPLAQVKEKKKTEN